MKNNSWAQIQCNLGNVLFATGLIMAYITAINVKTSIELAMLSASTITIFYFWWGYIFLAQIGLESKNIISYFYDFMLLVILFGLFYLIGMENSEKPVIWLITYLFLFVMAIFKYILLLRTASGKGILFCKEKLKIESQGAVVILFLVIAAFFFKKELIAIWLIFFMEFFHILYVGLIDKFYEKWI